MTLRASNRCFPSPLLSTWAVPPSQNEAGEEHLCYTFTDETVKKLKLRIARREWGVQDVARMVLQLEENGKYLDEDSAVFSENGFSDSDVISLLMTAK